MNAKQAKTYEAMIAKAVKLEEQAKKLRAEAESYVYQCEKFDDFKDYFMSFYGQKGLYPMNLKASEFDRAFNSYLITVSEFHGDTLDRERVRDLILANR